MPEPGVACAKALGQRQPEKRQVGRAWTVTGVWEGGQKPDPTGEFCFIPKSTGNYWKVWGKRELG